MSAAPRGAPGENWVSRDQDGCRRQALRRPQPCATRPRSGGGGRPRPGRTTPPRIPGPSNPAWRGGGSGPRGARRNVQDVPRGAEKSQRVPLASPRLAGFLSGVLSQTLLLRLPCGDLTTKIQLSTVDHSVRGSMKTAANCES